MTSDLLAAVAAIREHAPGYALAQRYYEGDVEELFCSPAVKRALGDAAAGFDVNLARRPVDAVLDRLGITAVQVAGDEAATRRLVDTVWTPNKMGRYSKQVVRAALVFGDAYLIVWPGTGDGTVEIHYNSPLTTRMFYQEENPREKSHLAKLWAEGHGDDRTYRANLYYADRIERWVTHKDCDGKALADWREFTSDDGEAWPTVNPYAEVPGFHFRADEPYGRPEHRGAYGPQSAITKLSATLMSTIDYQGFPQRYALLKSAEGATQDQVDWDDDEQTVPAAGGLKASPGTLWELPGVDSVGQFSPADVKAFLEPLAFYARAMAAATATPLRFFEPSGDVPSGESLRADDAPLTHRIHDRQEWFGEEYAAALSFAGRVLDETFGQVDIKWRPVQTVDDEQGWKTALLKMQAGVPALQALTESGYTSELVEGWLAAAAASAVAVGPLDQLRTQADALGLLIRAGADAGSSAAKVGLAGLEFTGAVPVTLRIPERAAAGLEEK